MRPLGIPRTKLHTKICRVVNNTFKKYWQYQYQYFFGIAEALPILGLEETVLTISLTLSLTRNYRSISHVMDSRQRQSDIALIAVYNISRPT